MKELHVIFGTGPVGKATARVLNDAGKQVKMVNRSGQASDLPSSIQVVQGDAYHAAMVQALTEGATTVYQCAQPAYHEWVAKFPAMQAAIIAGVSANNAKLVVMENLYGYGDTHGEPIHEGLPLTAHTRKGKVRTQMSNELFSAHQSGTLRVASARASDFYGPEYAVFAEQVLAPAFKGKAANVFGSVDVPHSFSYIPDVGRTLATLGTTDRGDGKAWHVPSAPALTQREFLTKIYAEIGMPLKFRAMGKPMMWILGRFIPALAESVEMLYQWQQPFNLDSSAFSQTFGIQPTPMDVGIKATITWFRQQLFTPNQPKVALDTK